MADLEARREARRRKILQNSEKRMKILCGKPDTNIIGPKGTWPHHILMWLAWWLFGNLVIATFVLLNDKETETVNEESLITHDAEKKCEPVTFNTDNKETEENITQMSAVKINQDLSEKHSVTEEKILPSVTTDATVKHRVSKNTVKIHQPAPEKNLAGKTDSRNQDPKDGTPQTLIRSPQQQLELLRIVSCVFVAILSRMVLQLGYGLFYVQSVMVQFVALEIAMFYYRKAYLQTVSLPQQNMTRYVSGLLLLCGVKSDSVRIYGTIMGYVTAILEDLSLYIFAFIVCHLMVTN